MTPHNHRMETSSSPGNVQNDPDNHKYSFLPPLFDTSPLISEIPERLLQYDASICPSYNEQDVSTRRQSPQESICSPEEESSLQQDPGRQEQPPFLRHEGMQDQSEHASESSSRLSHGWNHAEAGQDIRKPTPKSHSWKEKLGKFAIFGLIAGSVLLFASIGTLAFLWFGSPAIPAWKEITARNWLSKAISICIGVIQQVMMLQLGIVTAIIASLTLESRDVLISDLASVSVMRATATSTGVFVLAWQYLSGGYFRSARHLRSIFLILSAALLWCLSQFLLLTLLTDVSLRSTAGLTSTIHFAYNLSHNRMFIDHNNTSTDRIYTTSSVMPTTGKWISKIPNYASFAEYSEPPYEADGVSDTGLTLRAFLPFGTAQTRENLKSYKGKATVLDARVTCQVPQIWNATVDSTNRFQGSLAATRQTPRLEHTILDDNSGAESFDRLANTDRSRDFDCAANKNAGMWGQWTISLCQLWQMEDLSNPFGNLVSEFQDSIRGNESFTGAAYLFLNCTRCVQPWGYTNSSDYTDQSDHVLVAEAAHERDEWLDLTFANGSATISASICYAAFDFADIDVRISSQSNRTESRLEPVFDRDTATYTFKELRNLMGQDRSMPLEKRGALQLEKGDWHVQAVSQEDYDEYDLLASGLRLTTDMAFGRSMREIDGFNSNMTSVFTDGGCIGPFPNYGTISACVLPENMHIWLVQEILSSNGSIAFVLQTMITLFSSAAYYDQMSQFDKWTQAEVTSFTTTQIPVGHVGFVVVMITVATHCVLVAYCVSLFLRNTTLSRLGASWSAVAQVATGDVVGFLGHATQASDIEIWNRLKRDGLESSKVFLKEIDGQVSIFISERDDK